MKRDVPKERLLEEALARVRERVPERERPGVERFVREYYARVAAEDLLDRGALDLYGAALGHWNLAQQRDLGQTKVHVYNARSEEHGWQSSHTVVDVITDDMPFLVDSVSMELTRRGSAIHLHVHPVVRVSRDTSGHLLELPPAGSDAGTNEAFLHVEVDRQTEPHLLEELTADLLRVLGDVRKAVTDWPAMRERIREIVQALDERPPPLEPAEVAEAKALLQWIEDDHFTFLGYREYELVREEGEDVLRAVVGSGLGILREKGDRPVSHSFAQLPPEVRRLARAKNVLNLTKANTRATVHRPSYLDYVGVKRFDDAGNVVAERRFLGLYTSTAYSASPREIPLLRRKVSIVLDRAGFSLGSHDHKALVDILENYPRDELFQIPVDELYDIALGILHLGERQRVRLFVRRDTYGRFLSCLVFVPRDRYNTDARRRIQQILQDAFGGVSVDHAARLSESVLARVHFVIATEPGAVLEYDVAEIEARLAEATRSWTEELADALVEELGEEQGLALHRRFGDAFPGAYRDDFAAGPAVADIRRIEKLHPLGDLSLSLWRPPEAPAGHLRFKLIRSVEPILLSDVLPLLENMGVLVIDERPYEVCPGDGPPVWIYDFGLASAERELDADQVREIFQDAFARVWRGEAENDGFNRLVLRAGLTAAEITILRATSKYLRQAGSTFSQDYMEESLEANPEIARLLVELFYARLDPERAERSEEADRIASAVDEALDAVESLDVDRILRGFLCVVRAVVRTNHFQRGEEGRPKAYLSFKLDPAALPDLPEPRPMCEIFVYSPRVEGVHLRGGKVARGGIRWSDRREDFRTEVLGLMKAQTVKNAVIVPVGAKGGFVVKQPPADREALAAEVVACYRILIRGLLDLTDNLVGSEVVPPPEVVRHDDDDPYLVVAADKGTATFSDVANELAKEYGFWLGDAFASGGSAGYDHKRMAITARGAWESVRRHFGEIEVDIESTDFTVVGIGDMSGDVFGNGMLLSRRIKLVGAVDHRHVFLDPDPDPEASFAERERLFALPRSSWADYDPALISPGGGVFPRSAKSIALSPEVRVALQVDAHAMTPNEVVSALLRAPVDLLWNGGIGTFVKASDESHADVGDRANDPVRVDARDLRCRVVGEGGNLGLTQRGRIEYALAGGRIFMDAIDNSAGVDCSDHEVNIKILLDAVVDEGDLTEKQRNVLLAEMEDEVAALVLRDNYAQAQAITTSVAQSAAMVDVHARYIRTLEQAGVLDRDLEFLPDEEALADRKAAGIGLTAPELAILLAYTKIFLYDELLVSDLPEDPYLMRQLERYVPGPLRREFAYELQEHRLRREIVASRVANGLVNRAGTTFAFRLGDETGAPVAEIARAFATARDIFSLSALWAEIEALDGHVPARAQLAMRLKARILLERSTRWLLRNRRRPLDVGATVEHFGAGAAVLAGAVPGLLADSERVPVERSAEELVAVGVPAPLASRVAHLEVLYPTLDIVGLAAASSGEVGPIAALYFELGNRLELHWLRDRIAALPRDTRWEALSRAALRDDLYAEQATLTGEILRSGGEELPTEERLETWWEANALALARSVQVIADVKSSGTFDLATLSVAVREIRNLIEAGAGSRVTADRADPSRLGPAP
ncbi:MAG: NAD-glutamate dehydrogenase [Actinobacteria bacterium]|nr:NAD-glutamate dehydrogenase [Actinomycetota bacterium]